MPTRTFCAARAAPNHLLLYHTNTAPLHCAVGSLRAAACCHGYTHRAAPHCLLYAAFFLRATYACHHTGSACQPATLPSHCCGYIAFAARVAVLSRCSIQRTVTPAASLPDRCVAVTARSSAAASLRCQFLFLGDLYCALPVACNALLPHRHARLFSIPAYPFPSTTARAAHLFVFCARLPAASPRAPVGSYLSRTACLRANAHTAAPPCGSLLPAPCYAARCLLPTALYGSLLTPQYSRYFRWLVLLPGQFCRARPFLVQDRITRACGSYPAFCAHTQHPLHTLPCGWWLLCCTTVLLPYGFCTLPGLLLPGFLPASLLLYTTDALLYRHAGCAHALTRATARPALRALRLPPGMVAIALPARTPCGLLRFHSRRLYLPCLQRPSSDLPFYYVFLTPRYGSRRMVASRVALQIPISLAITSFLIHNNNNKRHS